MFQVELRQSTKFMERFSSTLLRDYLGLIRDAIADGQATGVFRADINPTLAAKMFFGALDEMATNWILSRRRYSLEADADAVVDLFVNGVRARDEQARRTMRIGRRCSAPARWARRSPRTSPTPACRSLLLDVTADAARDGLKRARGAEAGSVLHAPTPQR